MRRVVMAISLGAILALMMLGGASAATGDTVGGNSVQDRQYSDGWNGIYLVDRNNPFDSDGSITQWEIWAENTNRVQLMIYRYSGGWSAVSASDVETPHTGFNRFDLDTAIAVQEGDYVGLHFPYEAGPVSFDLNGAWSFAEGDLSGSVLQTRQGGGESDFVFSSNRVYSVRAFGNADEDDDDDEDGQGSGDGQDRVGVCHATGNGSIFIEVSEMGWINGHEKHGDSLADDASDCDSSDSDSESARGNGRNR